MPDSNWNGWITKGAANMFGTWDPSRYKISRTQNSKRKQILKRSHAGYWSLRKCMCGCIRIHKRVSFEPVKRSSCVRPHQALYRWHEHCWHAATKIPMEKKQNPTVANNETFLRQETASEFRICRFMDSIRLALVLQVLCSFHSILFLPVSRALDVENKWQNGERKKFLDADEGVDCAVW